MSQRRVDKKALSYIVGIALGDGNLSNPNGRATRLRISCDLKYPNLIKNICSSIRRILPNNKVSLVKHGKNCCDISCYSNRWEEWLGWKALCGPKHKQSVSVPKWIIKNKIFLTQCLKGLIETDGSIYIDRNYKMVNFVTIIPALARDVLLMIKNLGFEPHSYTIQKNNSSRYNIRISKSVDSFIKTTHLDKT